MQKVLKLDGSMRAVAMAVGAAIATSVIAMLVPTGIWETITGSTGISELVPATGAPLGDTARALIAFSLGLLAFGVTFAVLLNKPMVARPANAGKASPAKPASPPNPAPVAQTTEATAEAVDAPSFFESVKTRLSEFVAKRRGENAVTELSDLPKLRRGDAHPDAPPRRPISAHTDLAAALSDAGPDAGSTVEPVVTAAEEMVAVVDDVPAPEAATPVEAVVDIAEAAPVPAGDVTGDVTAMVDRLEAAIALREQQLAKLEAIAMTEAAVLQDETAPPETVEAEILEPEQPGPPVLEAVPAEKPKAEGGKEMDAALRSALETLHRMNVGRG